jgi:hypothetical protein
VQSPVPLVGPQKEHFYKQQKASTINKLKSKKLKSSERINQMQAKHAQLLYMGTDL